MPNTLDTSRLAQAQALRAMKKQILAYEALEKKHNTTIEVVEMLHEIVIGQTKELEAAKYYAELQDKKIDILLKNINILQENIIAIAAVTKKEAIKPVLVIPVDPVTEENTNDESITEENIDPEGSHEAPLDEVPENDTKPLVIDTELVTELLEAEKEGNNEIRE